MRYPSKPIRMLLGFDIFKEKSSIVFNLIENSSIAVHPNDSKCSLHHTLPHQYRHLIGAKTIYRKPASLVNLCFMCVLKLTYLPYNAQEEIIIAGGQVEPPGMHMIYLPYSDDIRDIEEVRYMLI